MAEGDDTEIGVHVARLRIGMAAVALLHSLFWLSRRGLDPTETAALKFTAAGEVTVTAAAEAGEVTFVVRDTGCGIPPDQHELLFGKFMRLDSRATAPADGVGLGLSICRELVTLMGGRIALTSAGLGRGTEVRFTLPEAARARERRAANP